MPKNIGGMPSHVPLVEAPNGKFYGAMASGGHEFTGSGLSHGIIFSYDPITNKYEHEVLFDSAKGSNPRSGLILATNGKFYGTTSNTGQNNRGTLFEFDYISGQYTKLHDFADATGSYPFGKLLQASNGFLFGVTYRGGISNDGVIYAFNIGSSTYTKLHDFSASQGKLPRCGLIQASNGHLYGLTSDGGTSNAGVLFEYRFVAAQYSVKANFSSSLGRSPNGELLEVNPGVFWGFANAGGSFNNGSIYEFRLSNSTLYNRYSFNQNTTGRFPQGALYHAPNGRFYGCTALGGPNGRGVIFEFDTASYAVSSLFDFPNLIDGYSCAGNFIQASDGNFYGLTRWGGSSSQAGGNGIGDGVIFSLDSAGLNYERKMDINESIIGKGPTFKLVETSSGRIFGVNTFGGRYGRGVLFELNLINRQLISRHSFRLSEGYALRNGLMEASNGKLYGLAYEGGTNNHGTLFEYDPLNDTLIVRHHFDSLRDGKGPVGELIQLPNGIMYGMCQRGGTSNEGTIFEFTPFTGILNNRYNFSNSTVRRPTEGFVIGSNALYAVASSGNSSLFKYSPPSSVQIIHNFSGGNNGSGPIGPPSYSNGNVIGVCRDGGSNNSGFLYAYNINLNSFSRHQDFGGSSKPPKPVGSLLLASNGKYYGLSKATSSSNPLILFEYDPTTHNLISKRALSPVEGQYAFQNSLIEVSSCYPTFDSLQLTSCEPYQLPSGNRTISTSGNYILNDTLISSCSGDSIITINLSLTIIDTSLNQNGLSLTSNENNAQYQWLDCNNGFLTIANETSQSFIATANGSYAVEISKNNCKDTSLCYTVFSAGLNENSTNSALKLYPSFLERGQSFAVEFNELIDSYKIMSIEGKVIKSDRFQQINKIPLDIDKGFYFVQFHLKDATIILKKIVVY